MTEMTDLCYLRKPRIFHARMTYCMKFLAIIPELGIAVMALFPLLYQGSRLHLYDKTEQSERRTSFNMVFSQLQVVRKRHEDLCRQMPVFD